jgi:hypothetical protein
MTREKESKSKTLFYASKQKSLVTYYKIKRDSKKKCKEMVTSGERHKEKSKRKHGSERRNIE